MTSSQLWTMLARIVITLLILSPVVLFALEAPDPWPPATPPQVLVGSWENEAKSFVQSWYKQGSFTVSITIREDWTVEGTVGDATTRNAVMRRSRGWLGRMLHMASDYIIQAELEGALREQVQCGSINISLNLDETGPSGSAECSQCGDGAPGALWITVRDSPFTRVSRPD